MSKRFISTEMFSDSWFMNISVENKLFFIYLITNCDHAGIIDINWKLIEFQTGIKGISKGLSTVTQQFGCRLTHLRDNYYFIPKFIDFQYGSRLRPEVNAHLSVIRRLAEFGLSYEDCKIHNQTPILNSSATVDEQFSNSSATVEQGLDNSRARDQDKDKDKDKDKDILKTNNNTVYVRIEKFKEQVYNATSELPIEEVEKFIVYWTQKNPNDKKMAFEKEKKFYFAQRLATWKKNYESRLVSSIPTFQP
jgi:hypothetical protein